MCWNCKLTSSKSPLLFRETVLSEWLSCREKKKNVAIQSWLVVNFGWIVFQQQQFKHTVTSPQFVLVDLTYSFSHLGSADNCDEAGSAEQLFQCPLQCVTFIQYVNSAFQCGWCIVGILHLFFNVCSLNLFKI